MFHEHGFIRCLTCDDRAQYALGDGRLVHSFILTYYPLTSISVESLGRPDGRQVLHGRDLSRDCARGCIGDLQHGESMQAREMSPQAIRLCGLIF
jgi:hypothetical protein